MRERRNDDEDTARSIHGGGEHFGTAGGLGAACLVMAYAGVI